LSSARYYLDSQLARLQDLTNFGKITASNSVFFGGAGSLLSSPVLLLKPYISFVNHGLGCQRREFPRALYYEKHRHECYHLLGNGPLSLQLISPCCSMALSSPLMRYRHHQRIVDHQQSRHRGWPKPLTLTVTTFSMTAAWPPQAPISSPTKHLDGRRRHQPFGATL